VPRRLKEEGPGGGGGERAAPPTGELLLLLASAIWGFAFVAQKTGMSHVGPFTYNGVRFALGALVLLPLARRRPAGEAHDRARLFRAGLLAGSVLVLAASLQQIGIATTTVGNAGFITSLSVLFVPVLAAVIGRTPPLRTWAGAALACVGLYLLAFTGGVVMGGGDLLVLGSAVLFAVHILVIGRFASSPGLRPAALAAAQYAVVGGASLLAAAFLERPSWQGIRGSGWQILYGGLLSVGVAYTLQVAGQRTAAPARAAIVLSLEAVFAAIGGSVFLGERLTGKALAGCALMLAGIVVSRKSDSRIPRGYEGGAPGA
jgi:drug/metabolite transporter (DMT)-like permease